MSANDVLVLEQTFQEWSQTRGAGLEEFDPWEYFCAEHFLKPFALSDEDIQYGLIGGGQDGGADAIYFVVNNRLVLDDTDPKSLTAPRVNLVIMQIKSKASFSTDAMYKWQALIDDLLDLSKPTTGLENKYNPRLIEIIKTFKEKYLAISSMFPIVTVDCFYITKCAQLNVHPNVSSEESKLIAKVRSFLNSAKCQVHYVDAKRLWEQVQARQPDTRHLIFSAQPSGTDEGWIGLVRLLDYFEFLKDDKGELNESIFESNVRGFQGEDATVNAGIGETLENPGSSDFWVLNNGITVLTPNAQLAGAKRLDIANPQVVNGLQTSRQIFNHFHRRESQPDERRLLVRVIKTQDEAVRSDIIHATNSQNKMPSEALRMTDPVHRQIEALFKQNGLYYDRRKGQYKDEGKAAAQIISPVEVVQAVVAIALGRPDDARARPRDYFVDDSKYRTLFDGHDLRMYVQSIKILRCIKSYLARPTLTLEKYDQRNILFYLAMFVMCTLTNTTQPSDAAVIATVESTIDDHVLNGCYKQVKRMYDNAGADDAASKGQKMLKSTTAALKRRLRRRNVAASTS